MYGKISQCLALTLLATASLIPAVNASEIVKPFQNGDRIAIIGDSITAWGPYAYVVDAFYKTRYPQRKIYLYYHGIGGYTAALTLGIVDKILADRPNVATIMLGMNDSGYAETWIDVSPDQKAAAIAQKKAGYEQNMNTLIDKLKAGGVKRIIFIIPSIYDETSTGAQSKPCIGKNAFMKDVYGGYLRRKAREIGAQVIDLNAPMLTINQREQAKNPAFSLCDMNDRIHPLEKGHFTMGYLFLKAMGLEGKVSETVIKATNAKVLTEKNCKITNLTTSDGTIKWTYLAKALPYPTMMYGYSNAYVPFDREFNQEIIRVTHLRAGNYTLTIDGAEVGKYTKEELAKGINLATNAATPQNKQVNEVNQWMASATFPKNSAFGYWMEKWNSDEATNLIYDSLHPKPHRYELKPVE